jgi:signal transduction histidine kinase
MFTALHFQSRPVGVIAITAAPNRSVAPQKIGLLLQFTERTAPLLATSVLYTRQIQQKELIEAVLASTPSPIVVLNPQHQITRLNSSAAALFTEHQSPLSTALPALLTHYGLSTKELPLVESDLSANVPFHRQIALGKQNFVLQGSPLPLSDKGQVVVLHDITSLKELDALKTQMIRMASHDLKNPIGVVMGYSEMLMDDAANLSFNHIRYITSIKESAARMLNIVTDLLNLERIKAGSLDLSSVEVQPLLEDITDEYRQQAYEKHQELSLNMSDLPPELTIQADKRQLYEALSNLVGNAIKYTPDAGKITVQAALQPVLDANNESKLLISVKDTGYGIAPEAQKQLFQPFYRVRTLETESIPGSGLGLNLVKTVIEAHRGSIRVESAPGQGSTFYVELSGPNKS